MTKRRKFLIALPLPVFAPITVPSAKAVRNAYLSRRDPAVPPHLMRQWWSWMEYFRFGNSSPDQTGETALEEAANSILPRSARLKCHFRPHWACCCPGYGETWLNLCANSWNHGDVHTKERNLKWHVLLLANWCYMCEVEVRVSVEIGRMRVLKALNLKIEI